MIHEPPTTEQEHGRVSPLHRSSHASLSTTKSVWSPFLLSSVYTPVSNCTVSCIANSIIFGVLASIATKILGKNL